MNPSKILFPSKVIFLFYCSLFVRAPQRSLGPHADWVKWLGRVLASEEIADWHSMPTMKGALVSLGSLARWLLPAQSRERGGFLPRARGSSLLLFGSVFLSVQESPRVVLPLHLPKASHSSPVNKPEVWSWREAHVPGVAHSCRWVDIHSKKKSIFKRIA